MPLEHTPFKNIKNTLIHIQIFWAINKLNNIAEVGIHVNYIHGVLKSGGSEKNVRSKNDSH